jgi:hypothetical protein
MPLGGRAGGAAAAAAAGCVCRAEGPWARRLSPSAGRQDRRVGKRWAAQPSTVRVGWMNTRQWAPRGPGPPQTPGTDAGARLVGGWSALSARPVRAVAAPMGVEARCGACRAARRWSARDAARGGPAWCSRKGCAVARRRDAARRTGESVASVRGSGVGERWMGG